MSIKADFVISVHPGEILQMLLDEGSISQTRLASHIGVTPSKISELSSGKRGVSAEMAVKLGLALGQDPRFWLDGQQRWELSRVDASKFKVKKILKSKLVGTKVV